MLRQITTLVVHHPVLSSNEYAETLQLGIKSCAWQVFFVDVALYQTQTAA
jgi:hypothetical protein